MPGGSGLEERNMHKQLRQPVIIISLIFISAFAISCEDDEWFGQHPPTNAQSSLGTRGQRLVDQQGRTVILRGVNYNGIESMLFTQQPPELDDFKKIKRWGFNVIRFPLSWDFIEPERDHYDEDYLRNWVEPVLNFAAQEGIGVLLDPMHQWNWSTCFFPPRGRGNGVPLWALAPSVAAHCPYTGSDAYWRMMRAPTDFWANTAIREKYIEMWEMMARRYGDRPEIIGYDLFNEPMPSTGPSPADFDQQVLQPFHEELIRRIRAISPRPLIIYEPVINWDLYPNYFTPMPFDRVVYSPHIYTGGTAGGLTGYNDNPAPLLTEVQKAVSEAQVQGVPVLVGEFGIGIQANYQDWIRDEFHFQEQYMVSGTWWSLRQHNNATFGLTEFDTRAEKTGLLDFVSRPYPTATAGELSAFSYDEGTKTFTMTFANSPEASGETIISVPDYQYHGSISVQCSDPDGSWSYAYDPAESRLHVTVDPGKSVHTITVTPR
jgi:endoglycosylceramidase